MKTKFKQPRPLIKSFFALLVFIWTSNSASAQFTMNGSTLNSGDYTCGVSTFTDPAAMADETNYSLTICPAAGEIAYINFGTIVLNNNGGTGSDDILVVTQGAATLYTDGPNSTGADNFTVSGTIPGACITVTLQVHDNTPNPIVNGVIGCLPAPDAGTDQSPGDCSTSTTLVGNDVSPATGTWTVSPSAGVIITDPNDPNSGVTGMVAGTSYTFTWTSDDGSGSASDDMIFNSVGPGCWTYCSLNFTDCDDEVITNVDLGGTSIPSVSNCPSASSYSDETGGTCIDVNISETYTLCVDVSMTAGWTDNVWAFFDWDNNGTFETSVDLGNLVGSGQRCIDITVPAGATAGNTVMRIVISEVGDPTACTAPTATYGDVIDICVNVLSCATTVPDAGSDQNLASCVQSATFAGNVIAQGTGTWTLASGAGIIADPSSPTSGVSSLGAGDNIFVWSVNDAPCPMLTDTVIITTNDVATPANAGDDVEACAGGSFAMAANAPGVGETGAWSCTGGSCGSQSPLTSTDPNQSFTVAGAAGTSVTMTWTLDNGMCTSTDDVVLTVITNSLTADAGNSIADACQGTTDYLEGVAPANGVGTWTTSSSAIVVDPNDPTSAVQNLLQSESVITMTWTVSASGCTSVADVMTITVSNCDPTVYTMTGCGTDDQVFTDGVGNYADNEYIKQTYCPDNPGTEYVTIDFTSWAIYSSLDWMTIIDGDGVGDPFIGSYTAGSSPGTITSSSDDGCLTMIFMSNASNNAAGWVADVSCTTTAGSNTQICNDSDCQGGCGRTICGDGEYSWAGDGISMPELNAANNDCLGANEQCNVWYYLNPASAGTLTLDIVSNGGQDQDFAVWQGFNSTLDCPSVSGDAPILCNWASMSSNGTGFNSSISGAAWEPTLTITQAEFDAGIYYMVLINTYNSGGACPQTTVDLTFGGTASLDCTPLGVMITQFSGVSHGERNYIYWKTINESNNAYFTLYKSKNGNDWSAVGVVAGAGNSDRELYYSLWDDSPEYPVTYYRLEQTDFDGTTKKSHIVSVSRLLEDEQWISDIFPNPVTNSFTFQYNGNGNVDEKILIRIYDMLGRLIQTDEHSLKNGQAGLIYTDKLNNGQYTAVFSQGDISETKQITILR